MIKDIPLLGLGTWGLGGKFERDNSSRKESLEALRYGLKLGFQLIDTAEIYGNGLTEEIVGEAIHGYPREQIFLISKVWKDNLGYEDVLLAVQQSLKRLQTDYLDLYLIHWPNEAIPLSDTMSAMESLVERGIVRRIGVSNFSVTLLNTAQSYLRKIKLFANEIEYNLATREAEQEIIPFCKEQQIKVIAYRPLARGVLANSTNVVINDLAKKYHKTQTQIILNWFITQDIAAIPKAISKVHLQENIGALGWEMDEEDVRRLK